MRISTKYKKRFYVPDNVPSGMCIIIDTREQLPLKFQNVPIKYQKLEAGDYSLVGFEDKGITIERKSIDFLPSITRDRERFEQELKLLTEFEAKAIVVEASYDGLVHPPIPQVHVSERSIVGTVASITVTYGVPILFVGGRKNAAEIVYALLRLYYEKKRGGTNWEKKNRLLP